MKVVVLQEILCHGRSIWVEFPPANKMHRNLSFVIGAAEIWQIHGKPLLARRLKKNWK